MKKVGASYQGSGARALRLISNIRFIQLGNARLECSAILLVDEPGMLGGRDLRIRGFKNWPTNEAFTLFLKSNPIPYRKESAEDRMKLFVGKGENPRPLFVGETLSFADGTQLFVQLNDPARPLQEDDVANYEEAWKLLTLRSLEFYDAPFFAMEAQMERTEYLKIHRGVIRPLAEVRR